MALGKRRAQEDEGEIDLTPMLDVVFIMLIFFIVTASFVNEAGITVSRPPPSNEPPPPPDEENKNIVFKITEANDIMLAGRRIDVRAVRANVERIRAENPEAKVIIDGHPKAKSDLFIKVSDQAREAGAYDISLVTKD